MGDEDDETMKVLIVGDIGTGKTSIIKRFVHNIFSIHYKSTIGVDFALKVIQWENNKKIKLQLWDIAGQERFGNLTRVYYKDAVGAFLVFDVTRSATFDAVLKWKSDLDAKVTLPDGRPIPVVLLANKVDLNKDGFTKTQVEMEKYCEENGFAGWFETSAKDNLNIDKAAKFLVQKMLENENSSKQGPGAEGGSGAVNIGGGGPGQPQPAASGGCC